MDSAFAYLRNKDHRNSLILIAVLLLGLIVGLILIRNPQIFKPRASADSIEVQLGDNVKVIDNEKVVVPPVNYQPGATIPIKIKLTSPFGADGTGTPAPSGNQPTPTPSGVSSPSPTPSASTLTLNAVQASCTNNNPQAALSWIGTPGQGASGDTANVGKSGFYVDVSPSQNFDQVYNKFVESSQSAGSTDAPSGFVLANANSTNPPTGSPLSLTNGTTYYARAFNGIYSNVQSFVASCTTGGIGGNVVQAEAVISNWGKTVSPGTSGDISNNDGVVDSLDFEAAFKGSAVQSFLNNLIPTVNAADSDEFDTCYGRKTIAQAKTELTAAGYNGPWDDQAVKDAYLRTACPGGQPAGGTTKVLTCKGESITIDQLNQELQQSGYDLRNKTLTEKLDAYRRAACPLGNPNDPVTTCKSPNGGPKTIGELMRDLRAANYPDQGFQNTTLAQAVTAYNAAQPECTASGLVGYNDDQANNCQVRGWAAKPNSGVATQVNVKLYKGDKTELITTVKADKERSDLASSRPELRGTNFGFEFTLPDTFKGSTTPVFAYAVDPSNPANEIKLTGNPRNITCTAGTSTHTASPTSTPTNLVGYYKLIESEGGTVVYEDTAWKPLTSSPLTIDHGISGNPGEKTITVIFKALDNRTETRSTKIKVISISPEITNLTCNIDQASGGIVFEARGKNFNTNSKIYVKEGTANKELDKVGASTLSLIKGTYKTTDVSKEHGIVVINPDGRTSNEVKCKTGSKAFQLRANVFCQQIWPFDVTDVEMTFIDRSASGSRATEKVTIAKEGFVKDIKSKLQPGRNYSVAIKAPKSLRKVVNFTATEGTDVIDSLMLPVGDIWGPGGRPDGVINANDRGRFNEDWRVLTDSPDIRLSDFNRDKRVNSFDWACMRQGFNESDDPIPGAGATATYKFDPATPTASQKVRLTVDNVSLAPTTYDYIALRVKPKGSLPEKYLWFKKQTLSTQGPPFFWESDDERNTKLLGSDAKFYDLSTNGEYSFQMVAHCKYPANEDAAFPDCSEADIFFNEVTLTVGQIAAPTAPTVQTSCTNNNPVSTFSWTGTAGKGADADTANKGKTGFYVDISTTPAFDLVNNKFIEGTGTTTNSTGFVLANAGRSDTGSPFVLTAGTKYYVRVFNGKHSQAAEFIPSCTSSPSPAGT